MPTVIITLRSPDAAQRRVVLFRGHRQIAVLQFVGSAEKIDLAVGSYVLEWSVAGPPGTPIDAQVSHGGRALGSAGPMNVGGDGRARGEIAFELD